MPVITASNNTRVVRVVDEKTVASVEGGRENIVTDDRHSVAVVEQETRTVKVAGVGIQGPAGEDGDKHYRHVQATPAQVWVIDHTLDKFPAVTVVDSAGEQVEGNVLYTSQQQVVVSFTGTFSGEAFLN